jgi:ADP-heptose:LPS heptosyltransferase
MRFWGLDWKRPSVYLSNDDMGDMMKLPIDRAQRHIVLHPFAGLGDHYAMPLERYEPLCKALTGLGYQILVIGANYIRANATNPGDGCMGGNQENRETWTLDMPGVHNLVDKLNGRTATSLIEHADGFIGSHSCWANAAWSFAIPTVVLFPSEPWVMDTGGDPNLWAVREKRAQDMVVLKANCGSTDTMTELIRLHFEKLMKK